MKRNFIRQVAMVICLLFVFSVPVFASSSLTEDTRVAPSQLLQSGGDTDHGWYFSRVANNPSSSERLNVYTSGMPVSGTKVTTWSGPVENTHVWRVSVAISGQPIEISPALNRMLVLDANRTAMGTQCQVYTKANDLYADYAITLNSQGSVIGMSEPVTMSLPPRYNQTSTVYVTYTNVQTSVSGGHICTWNSSTASALNNRIWYFTDVNWD
ncbi:MAG: hypothetical protein PWQ08_514 [Clostridiales bacterium]|nr:hypothetical protein [Clostridiales bacterium]